ncbi:MAG: apolipoprotein N-acyltransferase [Phycisphaeraceae bacterium]|nr:apolipoprotein N-acyltransferase [Phycisphaeraceae bacterium]
MTLPPRHVQPMLGVHSWRAHVIHLLLCALMLALSFPPVGWWVLAYFALTPLGVLAARSRRGGRLALCSFVVFCLWWMFMVRWVSGVHPLAPLGIGLVLGAYAAAAVWALWWIQHHYRSAMTMTLPMVWISTEYLRGMFPMGGFAWLSLGHTQAPCTAGSDAGWIVQCADLFGEHTVGFLVAMSSGLLCDLLTRPLMRPGQRGLRRIRKTIRAALLLWAGTLTAALIYGHTRITQSPGVDDSTSGGGGGVVAVVQTNVPQDNKIHRDDDQDEQDFAAMVELTRQAAAADPAPDLIVWPETMVPSALNSEAVAVWSRPRLYHPRIADLARQLQTPLLVGAASWSDPDDLGYPTFRANSAFLYYADGQRAETRYDKQHLVPFGEYLPIVNRIQWLKSLFLNYISPYDFDYSIHPGRKQTVFEVPASSRRTLRVVTPICYEDVAGRVVRKLAYDDHGRKRADAIINLTNSAWYTGGGMRQQHLQIAVFRSIENRMPTARAVNTGLSAFIDSTGRIGPIIAAEQAGTASATLNLDARISVYGTVGAWPVTCMAVLTGALILGGLFRPWKIK